MPDTTEVCTYCDEPATTDDHVPARSFFPRPRPDNLVKVPACLICNRHAELDDEYLRRILLVRDDVLAHPKARLVWPAEARAFDKPTKVGMRQALVESLEEVNVLSPEGSDLGTQVVFSIDELRLSRIATRFAIALHRVVTGQRVQRNQLACGAMEQRLVAAKDLTTRQPLFEAFSRAQADLSRHDPVILGDGVFSYRCCFDSADLSESYWSLTFYEAVSFVVVIVPDTMIPSPYREYSFPAPTTFPQRRC